MNQNEKSIFNFDPPQADDSFMSGEDSEFSFEHPQSNDLSNLEEDITELSEPVRLMDCICPKCAEKTEVDLTQVPENGFVTTCSACKKKIHIVRESCACRAKRKSYEINCANCGRILDQNVHCHSCGRNFPDYFVTFNPDDARRKARRDFFSKRIAAIRNLNISFKPVFQGRSRNAVSLGYSNSIRISTTATATSSLMSRKFAGLTTRLIVTIALIAAGVFAFNSYKAGQIYTENYFKALYCIKTGIDANIKTCTNMKADWESAAAVGRNSYPVISAKEEARILKLRGEVAKYMGKLNDPPRRFSKANESLIKMHKVYLDTDTLIQSKPNSLQELGNSIDDLDKQMSLESKNLKANLTDSLKQELESVKLKYRGMKDF